MLTMNFPGCDGALVTQVWLPACGGEQSTRSHKQQERAGPAGPGNAAVPSTSTACTPGRRPTGAATHTGERRTQHQVVNHLVLSWGLKRVPPSLFNTTVWGRAGLGCVCTRLSGFPVPTAPCTPRLD